MRLRLIPILLAVALFVPAAIAQDPAPLVDDGTSSDGQDGGSSDAGGSSSSSQDQGDSNASAGDAATTTFYGHIFGHGMGTPMPFNTEFPEGEDNYGVGSTSVCFQTCAEEDTAKRLALFSTPGFVQVENTDEWESGGTYEQLHNERGQTKDVHLDDSQPITATIYNAYDFHSWFISTAEHDCIQPHPPDVPCAYPYWGWDMGVNPNAVFEAQLFSVKLGEHGANASEAPPVQEAIESGEATTIAEGEWSGTMMNGVPGTPQANKIDIDLGTPSQDTIPREEDLVLLYKWYSDAGATDYGGINWRTYSGEFFPQSYNLTVENPITVERVSPQFAHGQLAILGIMNTPWGSYDVDPESVEMTVEDPQGDSFTPENLVKSTDFSVAHGGHYKPVNKTWIWDYRGEGVSPGDYEVTVTASNEQGTATHECTATFALERSEQGDLIPGTSEDGLCGQQTAQAERVEELKEGAEEETEG